MSAVGGQMKKIPEDAILSYIEGHLDEHVGAEEVACEIGRASCRERV